MRVTMILEFPASYCHLARGIAQVFLLYFSCCSGVSGTIHIDANGDRDGDYSMWNMIDPEKGVLKVLCPQPSK